MSEDAPAPKTDPARSVGDDAGDFHPTEEPAKRGPSSPLAKGAKWGGVAGLVVAQLYLRINSPLGFYTGNMLLVFAVCIGLGTAIGVGIAWLSAQPSDDERSPE